VWVVVELELGTSPCTLSQKGQVSQRVAVADPSNSALGPGPAAWAGEERPPAKYGEGAKM